MAFSKNLIILIGLLFAFALLVSSQVAASGESTKTESVEEVKNGKTENEPQEVDALRCRYRCCRFFHGRCTGCCGTAQEMRTRLDIPETEVEETVDAFIDAGRCRYGCCRRLHGRCFKCCRTANETPETKN